jgi:hypothetical protein
MILDKQIKVKITQKNIIHFRNFYKDIKLKDIIDVDPHNLQKSSNITLNVECDICGTKRSIKYQAYTKNISTCSEHPIYTCDKCSHIKIKVFNREKWGVDYFSQTKEYTDKFKETMIERWGVEYALQSKELKDKAKKTNVEKFGFENPFMDNEMIKTKFQEKWGVEHPSKVPEIVEKIKIATKKNWVQKKEERIEKFKQTNLDKWGVDHPNKSDLVRNYKITNDGHYISYSDGKSLFSCDLEKEHQFHISSIEYFNRKRSNLPLCTVCYPIGDSCSIKENELRNFIKSIYSGEVIKSPRDPIEIDIYLPEFKLGFEFNGLFWHSERWKDKSYHINKTLFFNKKGIRIIHIWEDDWQNKKEIIQSQIRNWIGKTKRKIFARNCQVRIVESKAGVSFLNKNHIQGCDKSTLKLGLYLEGELVSIMTFDHFEGRKRMEESGWNLSRFCNLIDTNVVGGASKILSYFIKCYSPRRIVSYADRDWSNGGLYEKLRFVLISESKPDYKYIVEGIRVHKSNFKKSRLKYKETESGYVNRNGVERVWDCGKFKFQLLLE